MGIEEREIKHKLSDSERIQQNIKDYLKKSPLGSARFQAFFDFFGRKNSERILEETRNSLNNAVGQEYINKWASNLRMIENRKCLIDMQIEQKYISMPGYYNAYNDFDRFFGELKFYWERELKKKYPVLEGRNVVIQERETDFLSDLRADLLNRTSKENSDFYRQRSGGVAGG